MIKGFKSFSQIVYDNKLLLKAISGNKRGRETKEEDDDDTADKEHNTKVNSRDITPPKRKVEARRNETTLTTTATEVYTCMLMEGVAYSRDDMIISTFAIVNSIEAARLACRNLAMSHKDSHFYTYGDEDWKAKWWKDSFVSGVYDNSDLDHSKYRFKIWFDGPIKIQSASNIPEHPFTESDDDENDDEDENDF